MVGLAVAAVAMSSRLVPSTAQVAGPPIQESKKPARSEPSVRCFR